MWRFLKYVWPFYNIMYKWVNIIGSFNSKLQQQLSRGVLRKKCSENMQQIYRRILIPKCDFNNVALQFYWNCTTTWVFFCKFWCIFSDDIFIRTPMEGCFCWQYVTRWFISAIKPVFNSQTCKLKKFKVRIYILILKLESKTVEVFLAT